DSLPSFDAIVLQDFDAQPYGLEKYLDDVRRYVMAGGGLMMVGGESSFAAGGYAGTPLAEVLPVQLDESFSSPSADPTPFVPEWTAEGRTAAVLGPLRAVVGEELPEMPGANLLGDVRPGGVVLWSHPTRITRTGAKMPVLAIGNEGDGRSIAMGVDGAWKLEFSDLGARTAGRGHGALWDGLLGWLMRDPRFETAQMEIAGGCTAGLASTLRAHMLSAGPESSSGAPQPRSPTGSSEIDLEVTRIDGAGAPIRIARSLPRGATSLDLPIPPLDAGAYAARLSIRGGVSSRVDFACEAGGDEWADSRPDPERLRALAKATGGQSVSAASAGSLRLPGPTMISAERRVIPLAPPWAWTFSAALLLGFHWVARRRGGLS
ncbi:MAG: glutamine amidotransferase, partial [Polyangiaceae bacterium]